LPFEEALRRMRESRGWWRPDVYNAFMQTVALGKQPAA